MNKKLNNPPTPQKKELYNTRIEIINNKLV